jgi:hypothetical protein
MDLKIDFGPWKTNYEGMFSGHKVEIISNPENFFLVFIFDTSKEGEKLGALVEGYKAFFARGQLDNFIETLPKNSLGITKNNGDKISKIFFSSFDPIYIDFKHEDFLRKLDKLLERNIESNTTIMDLARASSLELKELNTIPASEYDIILGDPFTMRALIGGHNLKNNEKQTPKYSNTTTIQLGLNKNREIITEDISNFKTTLIYSNTKKEYEYTQYILAENILLGNKPVFIFDDEDYFSEMRIPSNNNNSLKDSLVEFDPIGFPIKIIKSKENAQISIKDVDFSLAMKLLETGDSEFNTKLTLAKAQLNVNKAEELAQEIQNNEELSAHEKLKAERICMLLAQQFKGMFGENIDVDELLKSWPGNLGRATIINIKNLSDFEKIFFVRTLLRIISKKIDSTKQVEITIILPNADKLFSILPEKASDLINDLTRKGVGFIFGTTKKDFNQEIEKIITTNLTIVSGNDIAVAINGQKNYRLLLRPSLSGNPKTS